MTDFLLFALSILVLTVCFGVFILTVCVPFGMYMISRLFWPGVSLFLDGKVYAIYLEDSREDNK